MFRKRNIFLFTYSTTYIIYSISGSIQSSGHIVSFNDSYLSLLSLSFVAMKKIITSFLFLSFFYACNNTDQQAPSNKPENDLDAARMFIRNALDGKFYAARQLMVSDTTNDQRMSDTERNYEHMSEEDRQGYRNANIQIHNTRNVNDSTRIVAYSNSYKNKIDSLKVVRVNGQWLVDLKFTFQDRLKNGQ